MKINIKGHDLELHYSMRILINYEELTGKSLNFEDLNSFTNLSQLFFSSIIASLQYNRQPLDITWDDFIDWIDENGGFTILTEFGNWYAKILTANLEIETKKNKNKDTKKEAKKSDLKLEKNV